MVKSVLHFIFLTVFSITSSGATVELYEAMAVKDIKSEEGVFSKQISTLNCLKRVVQNSVDYTCTLRPQGFDGSEIYNNLNVPEVDGRPRDKNGRAVAGTSIFSKSVGGLTCKKVTLVFPDAKPKFSCELQF